MTTAYLQRFAYELRRRNRARGLSVCPHDPTMYRGMLAVCDGCGSTLQELYAEGLL